MKPSTRRATTAMVLALPALGWAVVESPRCPPFTQPPAPAPLCGRPANQLCSCLMTDGVTCWLAPGTADCSDDDVCTDDTCDDVTGCHHARLCDDGDPCNGAESCVVDVVPPFVEFPVCFPGIPPCDDGIGCNGTETCTATGPGPSDFLCQSGAPPSCDDANACTQDTCVENPTHCERTAVSCDDRDVCTSDACDPVTGCTHVVSVVCDDHDPCTVDGCDPVQGCSASALGGVPGLTCVCARTLPAACSAQVLPSGIGKRVDRACHFVSELADGDRSGAAVRRLVRKAEKALLGARSLAERAGHNHVSAECRQALTARLADDAQRATALRGILSR